jgi:hypothetical protein
MKTKSSTKKYKNNSKSNSKIKNKSRGRKRILKGGVSTRRSSKASTSRPTTSRPTTSRPTQVSKPIWVKRYSSSSRASVASNTPSICCDKSIIEKRDEIIEILNNFPHSFEKLYINLISQPHDNTLIETITKMKELYTKKTTISGYLNITGLQFINYLRSKYMESNYANKKKIRKIISLFDQHGMSHGVRDSDLIVIKKLTNPQYYECYKKLYDMVHRKIFRCNNDSCYPLSTSSIPLYCNVHRMSPIKEGVGEGDGDD